MTILKTSPAQLGFTKGASVSITFTGGEKNGQSFNGELSEDIEKGKPITIDGSNVSGPAQVFEEHDGSEIYIKTSDPEEELVIVLS